MAGFQLSLSFSENICGREPIINQEREGGRGVTKERIRNLLFFLLCVTSLTCGLPAGGAESREDNISYLFLLLPIIGSYLSALE